MISLNAKSRRQNKILAKYKRRKGSAIVESESM